MPTKKDRLLKWRRTRIGGELIPDDYIGRHPNLPGECRVKRSTSSPSLPPWHWIANGTHAIGQGYEDQLEWAVDAAEDAYRGWMERARQ